MHCSQCKSGNSSPFFLSWESGIGWLVDWHRYCFISRLQRSFSLFGFRPVVVVDGGVPSRRYYVASISCRRRFQTRCAVHLSAIAIFSVATTARRVGRKKKLQNTAQPEVYLSLNRSLANRLLTAESTYFEKERVACLFCIMVVVRSATGEMTPSHEQVASFFDARSVSLCF